MAMDFIIFTLIIVICDLCIVITQIAGSGNDRDYPRKKDKGVLSDWSEEIRKKSRLCKESLVPDKNSSREIGESSHTQSRQAFLKKPQRLWNNEQYRELLRVAYTNYHFREENDKGPSFSWKEIFNQWNKNNTKTTENVLRLKTLHLESKMQPSQEFDEWPKKVDNDLLRIYFLTEEGSKLRHAETMHAVWLEEHPEYNKLTPHYLLKRAESMLQSIEKFSLDNPKGPLRLGQKVEWKIEHDIYLQKLWEKYDLSTENRARKIHRDAKRVIPGIKYLQPRIVYEHIRKMNLKSEKNKATIGGYDHPTNIGILCQNRLIRLKRSRTWNPIKLYSKVKDIMRPGRVPRFITLPDLPLLKIPSWNRCTGSHEGSAQNPTRPEYHSFLDEHNFPSTSAGIHHHHGEMASSSSHPEPSHGEPDLDLRLNNSNYGDRSPDTNLKLGW